ncbi:hypothetical protein GOP47_0009469 [Adiantum capillus-veneris]|uniref:Uncharacterized protein n=1 Tax=Adiantum capillus-veneris TaxID=13818 RepID=A0A9D4UXK0_ADICA|nr:hypothetical protein GOP47_0009469 [Adiantum capillus-veneris]
MEARLHDMTYIGKFVTQFMRYVVVLHFGFACDCLLWRRHGLESQGDWHNLLLADKKGAKVLRRAGSLSPLLAGGDEYLPRNGISNSTYIIEGAYVGYEPNSWSVKQGFNLWGHVSRHGRLLVIVSRSRQRTFATHY